MAYHGGSNPPTVAAIRFLVPAAALIVWLRATGISLVLPKREAFVAAALGVVTALYTWALLKSISSIPFALAVLILYLFPLMAAVIVAALGWEKFAWRTGAAIVLAFAGLALALGVRGNNLNIERARDRYVLDPADIVRADREARARYLDIVGFWHSHPDHPARPSDFDTDHAWVDYVYIIVNTTADGAGDLNGFTLAEEGGPFRQLPLMVTPGPGPAR